MLELLDTGKSVTEYGLGDDSLMEGFIGGGVVGAVFDADDMWVRLAGDPIGTPIPNGGVHGALRGPLPIGPNVELDEVGVVDKGVCANVTCRFPLYPGALDASILISNSGAGGEGTVSDEVMVEVGC